MARLGHIGRHKWVQGPFRSVMGIVAGRGAKELVPTNGAMEAGSRKRVIGRRFCAFVVNKWCEEKAMRTTWI